MIAVEFWREQAAFEAYNQSKDLSPRTIEAYTHELGQFHRWFVQRHGSDAEITTRRIREYMAERLARGLSWLTVKASVVALRSFFHFLIIDEVITVDQNPMRLVETPRGHLPEIHPLIDDDIHRFLDSFDKDDPLERRNFVICLLMLDTGLRVGEVSRLKVEDVDFDEHSLVVNGKGRKKRVTFFGGKTKVILQDYLETCRPGIANGHRTLFPPGAPSSRVTMHPRYISEIIRRKFDELGIERHNSTAHRLRHTFAVNFVRGGGNAFALQRLLGHSKLEMTQRYVLLARGDLREAYRKASPMDRLM